MKLRASAGGDLNGWQLKSFGSFLMPMLTLDRYLVEHLVKAFLYGLERLTTWQLQEGACREPMRRKLHDLLGSSLWGNIVALLCHWSSRKSSRIQGMVTWISTFPWKRIWDHHHILLYLSCLLISDCFVLFCVERSSTFFTGFILRHLIF